MVTCFEIFIFQLFYVTSIKILLNMVYKAYTEHNFLFSRIQFVCEMFFYYRYRQFMIAHIEKITQLRYGYYERKYN